MNEEAANKILKILEEPWEKTLFVLVSERPDLLLLYFYYAVRREKIDLRALVRSAMPVSYTHLDVYKRQVVYEIGGRVAAHLQNIVERCPGGMCFIPVGIACNDHFTEIIGKSGDHR